MPARRGKAAFSLSGSYSFRKRGSTRTITPRRGCYRCGECLGAHAPIYVATPPVGQVVRRPLNCQGNPQRKLRSPHGVTLCDIV